MSQQPFQAWQSQRWNYPQQQYQQQQQSVFQSTTDDQLYPALQFTIPQQQIQQERVSGTN